MASGPRTLLLAALLHDDLSSLLFVAVAGVLGPLAALARPAHLAAVAGGSAPALVPHRQDLDERPGQTQQGGQPLEQQRDDSQNVFRTLLSLGVGLHRVKE